MTFVDTAAKERAVGANVLALRDLAGVSQQALAQRMRDMGHKWSQATVWAVEKGERALRFSEAQDLVRALDEPLWKLELPTRALQAASQAGRVQARAAAVVRAVFDFIDEQEGLRALVGDDDMSSYGDIAYGLVLESAFLNPSALVAYAQEYSDWAGSESPEESDRPKRPSGLAIPSGEGW